MNPEGRELAEAIRTWRRRASPPPLAGSSRRRVPGLRREELAERAGISVEYVVRLEQGRALRPSAQVLSAIARALDLVESERDVLFAAAGLTPPPPRLLPRHVGSTTRRLVSRTSSVPIAVFSRAWDLLLGNELWFEVFGAPRGTSMHASNLAWQHLVAGNRPLVRSPRDEQTYAERLVWDVRREAARHPSDLRLADLRRQLEPYADTTGPEPLVDAHDERVKTVRHRSVGRLSLTFDRLHSPEDGTWVTIYTPAPGSVDARRLALLAQSLDVGRGAVG